jgi:2-polyprenyl-3-methyl-5-hydroxy-6-metoxy-1,4-benzoquinol methylase
MDHVCCPLCAADQPVPAYQVRDWTHGLGDLFTMLRCGQCGALYLNPRPNAQDLARYYPTDYAAYTRESLQDGPWLQRQLRRYGLAKRCRAVARLAKGGRLLDIGCATGDFIALMETYGRWSTAGIEMDKRVASLARGRYGLQVYSGSVDSVTLPAASFDVITLWDVLEHLPDPRSSLARIAAWLRPGGWLVIRTPDAGSPYARIWGQYWAGLDAPRHLVVFDRASLARLLEETGFKVERMWSLSGSHAVTVLSSRSWLRAKRLPLFWSLLLANPVAQVLTWPLFWIFDRRGGALVTVSARQVSERGDDDRNQPGSGGQCCREPKSL